MSALASFRYTTTIHYTIAMVLFIKSEEKEQFQIVTTIEVLTKSLRPQGVFLMIIIEISNLGGFFLYD